MKKKLLGIVLGLILILSMFTACTQNQANEPMKPDSNATEHGKFNGKELSILVSAGWMDNRYDETIARFEEEYGVVVDLQTIPADQYDDVLQSKLTTDSCTDIFWIQSNPFAISSVIGDPEKYCLDFTGEEWEKIIPEVRLPSCKYNGKLYGLQLWHNSPEYVMLYNKTLFNEMGLSVPTTYNELLDVCEKIAAKGITPWFMPGADGWRHQLAFFQIGGVYEAASPGLYEKLNNNQATFKDNQMMIKALEQFRQLEDKGYFGEDWIGTDSSNMVNEFGDRTCAMALENSSYIKQIKEETGTKDEFGLFLEPICNNTYFPSSPAGPTMFGYKGTQNPELVKEFFNFVTTTESLQEILDNSPKYTNIHANDPNVKQNWLPEETVFMDTLKNKQMLTPVLQNGTKYTNDYWMQFGSDMVAYCTGQISANEVLEKMDANRAESAKVAKDPAWINK